MRKTQIPFLQKFAGKTTRISKNGIIQLLQTKQFLDIKKMSNTPNNQQEIKQRPSIYRDTHKSIDNKYQQQVNLDSIIPDPIHIREKQKNSRRDAQLRRSSNSSAVKKIEYVPSFGDKKSKLNETELKRNEVTYASLKKFRDQSTKIEKQLTSLTKQQLNSIKKTDSKTEKTQKGDNSVYNTLGTYGENLKKNKDIMNHFQFLSSIEHKVKIKN